MYCSNCGHPISENAKFCGKCGCVIKKSEYNETKMLITICVVVPILVLAILFGVVIKGNGDESISSTNMVSTSSIKTNIPPEFNTACPVKISTKLQENILEYPQISCKIINNSNKKISAVKFYFVAKNVYGEEVDTILSNNKFYTHDEIDINSSIKGTWDLYEESIKSGDLYVYSVYFSDGTEWGDREASVSEIKKYGYKVVCSF